MPSAACGLWQKNKPSGLIPYVVHQIDSQWHHIELSIVCIYDKLVGLGFVYYNEEISIVESEEKQKYV